MPAPKDLSLLHEPCTSADALHAWANYFLDMNVPRRPVCTGHAAPFDYLRLAYFEPARDLVIWAPRGGGKTRLAAAATLLDLLHKPGCAVRIIGGSLEQSYRVWEHLLPDLEALCADAMSRRRSQRRVELANGSTAAALSQSQRAVRGLRVQKIRCDEVELFKPEIWEAAQLATKSRDAAGKTIAGAIEAISTLHHPFGLMNRVVEAAESSGKTVLKWCLLEVLARCEKDRDCATCPLWDDCRGVAKQACSGFVSIDDAISLKRRVSQETWEAEMLCKRPSVSGCVFPSFDTAVHVSEDRATGDGEMSLAIDFGFASPFVCLWIVTNADGSATVIDEYVQREQTIEEHLSAIDRRAWGKVKTVACDPAGCGKSDQTAVSNVAILRSRGHRVFYRSSQIVDGLEMIRAALRPASGPPTLFIHPRCVRLIKAMRAYHYSPGGSELPVKDGEFDHPIDALRYYFVNRGLTDPPRRRRY